MTITITGHIPSKKNSKRLVRGRLISSKAYMKWHDEKMWEMKQYKAPKHFFGTVRLTFYARDKRKNDLTNKAESIMDLLVDSGILPDDNWYEVPRLYMEFKGIEKDNPRCEVTLI